MPTLNFEVPLWQTSGGAVLVDVTFDGAVVSEDFNVTSSEQATPSVAEFTVEDVSEGSHTVGFVLKEDFYLDSDTDRHVEMGGLSYTTEYTVFTTHAPVDEDPHAFYQHRSQLALKRSDNYPAKYTALNKKVIEADEFTAVTSDGVATEGPWDTWGGITGFVSGASITWNYATDKRNEMPYRLCLNHDNAPAEVIYSTQLFCPWDESYIDMAPNAASKSDAEGRGIKFAIRVDADNYTLV